MFDTGALTTITPSSVALSDVDVVEADTGPSDDDEVLGGFERGGVDLGRRADDEGVRARHRAGQLLGREPKAHVDLVAGVAQLLETGVGDLLGDEYSGHGQPFTCRCQTKGTVRGLSPRRRRRRSARGPRRDRRRLARS